MRTREALSEWLLIMKSLQFTQKNMSAGADVFPPLLHDEVKLVS